MFTSRYYGMRSEAGQEGQRHEFMIMNGTRMEVETSQAYTYAIRSRVARVSSALHSYFASSSVAQLDPYASTGQDVNPHALRIA